MEYIPITDNKTTKEQSERLLELGLPAETADCCKNLKMFPDNCYFRSSPTELSNNFFKNHEDAFPVWTVGQLQRLIMMATGSAMYIHPDNSPMETCMRYAEIAGFAEYFKEEA